MEREEILAKSREENKDRDERVQSAMDQGGSLASAVGGLVCALVLLLDAVLAKHVNFGVWSVYFSMIGTKNLVQFAKLRRRRDLIAGVIEAVLAIGFFAIYTIDLIG